MSAAPPIPSPVALGATLAVTSQDGKKAAYNRRNQLPAAASQFTQVKGTLYSIDVTVQGITGSVPVSPLYSVRAPRMELTLMRTSLRSIINSLLVICHRANTFLGELRSMFPPERTSPRSF